MKYSLVILFILLNFSCKKDEICEDQVSTGSAIRNASSWNGTGQILNNGSQSTSFTLVRDNLEEILIFSGIPLGAGEYELKKITEPSVEFQVFLGGDQLAANYEIDSSNYSYVVSNDGDEHFNGQFEIHFQLVEVLLDSLNLPETVTFKSGEFSTCIKS